MAYSLLVSEPDFASLLVSEPDFADTPRILGDFCRAVGRMVQRSPEKETPARVAALLPDLVSTPHLLSAAQRTAPADGYARHTVFICPDDRFSVLAMVWSPGVVTPVHDHRSWCAFGVYQGLIEETRYRPAGAGPDGAMAAPVARVSYRVGDVGHLPVDGSDIHRMHNPTAAPAVSIHVYGGNFEKLGPNLGQIYAVEG